MDRILKGITSKYQLKKIKEANDYENYYEELEESLTAKKMMDVLVATEDGSRLEGFINLVFKEAKANRVSDIHFEPTRDGEIKMRHRIDGIMFDWFNIEKSVSSLFLTKLKMLAGLNPTERRQPQDGRVSIAEMDVRLNTIPSFFGEKVEARLLCKMEETIDDICILDTQAFLIKNMIKNLNGLVLATGPTGSGKSTTLHSIINEINDSKKIIMSIEEPVENVVDGITQISIDHTYGMGYDTALKACLRQDPDVLMVGEIRDSKTAQIAINAAITGHLLLSTLHNDEIASALVRLLGLGVDKQSAVSSLKGVIAQRLIRKLCPHCKQLDFTLNPHDKKIYKAGDGCEKCNQTGYLGRFAIMEVLELNDDFKDFLMKEDRTVGDVKNYLKNDWFFIPMERIANIGITKGLTSVEEVEKMGHSIWEEILNEKNNQ